MYNKIRLKRKIILKKSKYKMKKSTIFILIFICFVISLFLTFRFINKKISPVLMSYSELEMKKFSNLIINTAIANEINSDIDINELFIIGKDNNNEIKTIDFNPLFVNKLLTSITSNVHKNLKYIEQGKFELLEIKEELADYNQNDLKKGIIFQVPSGLVFNNPLLANIGPKIPVKLSLVGDIVSNVNTKVTNYGINNAMIEVSINVELNEQIILPFVSKKVNLVTNVPVAVKLIQGNVPNYYFNGIDKNSPNIAISVE